MKKIGVEISTLLSSKKRNYSYIVLFDPTLQQVIKLSDASDGAFIFIFLTGPVDSRVDWSDLPKSNYIINPYYLGCFHDKDIRKAASAIIESVFSDNDLYR